MPEEDRTEIEHDIALDDETIIWDADRVYDIGDSTEDDDESD